MKERMLALPPKICPCNVKHAGRVEEPGFHEAKARLLTLAA